MRNGELDRAMRQLAGQQHSVVSRTQVRRLGADRWALGRRLSSGEWEAPTPEVLRVVGSRATFR